MSTIEDHNPPSSGSISKKRRRQTSEVWNHFDSLPDGKRATCKYCSRSLCASSKMGTSHLKRHIETCKKIQGDTSQTPFIGSEKEKYERELEGARVLLKMKTEQIAILEKELNKAKVNAVTRIRIVQEAEQQKPQMEQHQKEEEANEQVEEVQEELAAESAAVDSMETTDQIEATVEGNLNDEYFDVASLREYDRIVNMTFASENEAFHFFNEYAKREGFSVRSSTKKDRLQNTIKFRQFCCSRQGLREKKYLEMPDRKRPATPISRCDCPVKLCIKLDPKTNRWWVQNFINDHNHDLTAPDCTPFLRSHCSINESQKCEISSMKASGIRNCQILEYAALCSGGYENRGFQEKNLYNYTLGHEQSTMLANDADSVLRYFKEREESDPDFFLKYDTKDGCLNRLFWADGQYVVDYAYFGDLVIFDSTYKLNRYNMVVVPFLGCNHHRSTIIFACGIVSCENNETYRWLLEAFLQAMYQKHPESVLTNGDHAMGKAIKSVFKGTAHRICSWHMDRNAQKYIHDPAVLQKFKELLSGICSREEFEKKWISFAQKVSQRVLSRQWLKRTYKCRESWAAAFVNKKMFLGMSSTQRSEGLNADLHSHIKSKMSLGMAVQKFERRLTHKRTKEAELDCKSFQKEPVLQTHCPDLEKSAAINYTPRVFRIVRDEIKMAAGLVVNETLSSSMPLRYIVVQIEKAESQYIVHCSIVEDNVEKLACSCAKLETAKLPCRHIFAVLIHMKATCIPRCCIRDRWTKYVKSGFPSDRKGGAFKVSSYLMRYHELNKIARLIHSEVAKSPEGYLRKMKSLKEEMQQYNDNHKHAEKCKVKQEYEDGVQASPRIANPKPVVTKGAPKKNKTTYERIKSAIESSRKNKCRHCGHRGHNRQTCKLLRQDNAAEPSPVSEGGPRAFDRQLS
ncbi:FAR1-related sequence 3 [Rhynchospora pubera]|uniref:FAR1-related sequence 3 n=1 Tax=Rhynchospora pubera TaxID=906938 RepID=A0AAV8DKQ8_9POAL|nr:FAR1-related sequence 3 [Rhynchospora pubera]